MLGWRDGGRLECAPATLWPTVTVSLPAWLPGCLVACHGAWLPVDRLAVRLSGCPAGCGELWLPYVARRKHPGTRATKQERAREAGLSGRAGCAGLVWCGWW